LAEQEQQFTQWDVDTVRERRKYAVRRSQLEIRMDILRVVHEGASSPTQIMYKANLAWVALQENLAALTSAGFLAKNTSGNRRRYELTEKGLGVLNSFLRVLYSVESAIPQQS
jgi:predicted transcriptional regulator